MASRIKLIAIVLILTLVGGGLAAYKHNQLGIPLKVGDEPAEWLVEAKVSFIATGESVNARLSLPTVAIEQKAGLDSRSSGYSFMVEDNLGEYAAVWSADKKAGIQALYYRVRFPERGIESGGPVSQPGKPPEPDDPGMARSVRPAADSIVRRAKELSSNPATLVAGIFRELNDEEPSQETALLKKHYQEMVGSDALTSLREGRYDSRKGPGTASAEGLTRKVSDPGLCRKVWMSCVGEYTIEIGAWQRISTEIFHGT